MSLQLVAENKHQIHEAIKFYNEVNEVFVEWLTKRLTTVSHGGVWKYLLAYKMLILSKENFGISTTIGIEYYTVGVVSEHTFCLKIEATDHGITTITTKCHAVLPTPSNKNPRNIWFRFRIKPMAKIIVAFCFQLTKEELNSFVRSDTLAEYQLHTAIDYDPSIGNAFNQAVQNAV